MKANGYEIAANADLRHADLRGANLSDADLRGANLRHAIFRGANLSDADLANASLASADLSNANLANADLADADLANANLSGADLRGAILANADLRGADLPHFQLCPQEGAFTAYKKVREGVVLTIEVPADAVRTSSLVNRKCRATHVRVVSASDGSQGPFYGLYNSTRYEVGHITRAHEWSDDPRLDCAPGIHFFMTYEEAEEWYA